MLCNLCLFRHCAQVSQCQAQRPINQSADFQVVVCELVACHCQIIFFFWRATVHPEVGRDVRNGVMLCRVFMAEEKSTQRVGD